VDTNDDDASKLNSETEQKREAKRIADEKRRKAARSASKEERLAMVNSFVFVRHSMVEAGLEALQAMYLFERGVRANAAAIIASSGVGKSQLLEGFKRDILDLTKDDGAAASDVVIVEPSWDGQPIHLLNEIAEALRLSLRSDASRMLNDIVDYVRTAKVAAIALEDLHDLFNMELKTNSKTRWDRDIKQCLKLLRVLMNRTLVPFIFTTLPSGMRDIIVDPQFNDRVQCKIYLSDWIHSDAEIIVFLNELEQELPLQKPSNLSEKPIRKWLVQNAKNTRVITQNIRDSTREAILDGSERITLALLKRLYPTAPTTPEAGRAAAKRRQSKTVDSGSPS